MPGKPTPAKIASDPARVGVSGWEDRAVQRAVEAGRDQILERSRRIVAAASWPKGDQ